MHSPALPLCLALLAAAAGSNDGYGYGYGSEFGHALWQAIAAGENNNYGYSPFGINVLLSAIYSGAKGRTAEEISRALHNKENAAVNEAYYNDILEKLYQEKDNEEYVDIATGVFTDKMVPMSNEYLDRIRRTYRAYAEQLPLESDPAVSKAAIDRWAKERTHGYIPTLEGLAAKQRSGAVLASAFYINRRWAYPFYSQYTKPQPFHTPYGAPQQQVQMMHVQATVPYARVPELAAQAVQLPYRGGDFYLLVVLPDRADGLPELERRLAGDYAPLALARYLKDKSASVNVAIPRFSARYWVPFKDALVRMGVKSVFEKEADLSGMSDGRPYVHGVYQQAYVRVDEQGTYGGGVAFGAAGGGAAGQPGPQPDAAARFEADRPFLYFIISRNPEAVFFQGRFAHSQYD